MISRILEFGPEISDQAARLFGSAFLVQGDQSREDGLVVQRSGAVFFAPSISIGHSGIDRVVMPVDQAY